MSPSAAGIPQVESFFDPVTNTVSYVVIDPQSRRCALVDSVLDYDAASGHKPSCVKGIENLALSAAYTRSQCSSSVVPMPTATPITRKSERPERTTMFSSDIRSRWWMITPRPPPARRLRVRAP